MNPVRAPSFRPASAARLAAVPDWPRLPPDLALDRVVGIGVDSRGLVYVAHRGDRPLLCLRPDGTLLREVGAGVLRRSVAYDLTGPAPRAMPARYWLHGLHVDPWDHVWVTDVSRHLVLRFDPAGALVLTLGVEGEPGCDGRRFNQPTHVCVLPSGDFLVTDGYGNSRVACFSARGEFLRSWGERGVAPGEFHTPHVVTRDATGLLYVSDRENDRIQIFDASGRLHAVWPGLHGVDGLHAAADGWLYGSCGVDHALLRLDRSGVVRDVWVEPGLFTYPHAVSTDGAGAVYVADTGDDWVLDPASAGLPRRRYGLRPRTGGEGSRAVKLRVTGA
ncbi:MAG: hypothetical protein JNG83_15095 [Opitutaceae bacterium]|nr:hypothetical protein [Opitutaceae bacterium]